jgi:type VI secretion system protein ImpJ
MFLTPQHLQQLDRHNQAKLWECTRHLSSHPWGFQYLDIAQEELANFNFRVRECQVVLPGGILAAYPGNLDLPSREFGDLLSPEGEGLQVFMGIPELREDRPNLAGGASELSSFDNPRYALAQSEVTDSNSGEHSRSIERARLRGRLFFGDEERQGYLCVPLAKIKNPQGAEAASLDENYIPPCLVLQAWRPLHELAQEISSQVTVTLDSVSKELGDLDVSEILSMPRGKEDILKHVVLAGPTAVLRQMAGSGTLHPYELYLEMSRLCGSLAVFAGPMPAGPPPLYDHNALGNCFQSVSKILTSLLQRLSTPFFQRRAFTLKRDRLIVELQADWVTGRHRLYLAASGQMDSEDAAHQLDGLKLCAPSDQDTVVQRRLAALPVKWLRQPPRELPAVEGRVYGVIQTGGPLWSKVQEDLALVISSSEGLPFVFDLYVV